jgi:hypothetical protein
LRGGILDERVLGRREIAGTDATQRMYRREANGDRLHRMAQKFGDERHDHGGRCRAHQRPGTPDPGGRERRSGGGDTGNDQRFQRDAAARSAAVTLRVRVGRLHRVSLVPGALKVEAVDL